MADGVTGRKSLVDEEVGFLTASKPQNDNLSERSKDDLGPLLTREDLQTLDADEPIWRRVRIALFIIFWVIWIGLLLASILIIVFTPKCPPRPHLNFWQSKVGYWVDPFAYRDSNGDFVGDFNGLLQKIDYIKESIGAGFVVLGSFLQGHYTDTQKIGAVKNYQSIDAAAGTMDDFRSLVKSFHKKGMQVVISLDFNSISVDHPWAKNSSLLTPSDGSKFARTGQVASVTLDGSNYYSVLGQSVVDLKLDNEGTFDKIKEVLKFWFGEGIDGVMLTNAAFFVENSDAAGPKLATGSSKWYESYPNSQIFTNETVLFLQNVRKAVDEIASSSGKPKLLMVDPGNVGYGIDGDMDKSIKLLGTVDEPAAHAVVTRQLALNRGWKSTPSNASSQTFSFTQMKTIENASLVFSTATPTDLHHGDYLSLFISVLLPGTPLVYYGSELGLNIGNNLPPAHLYPMGKTSILEFPPETNVLLSQMPMPWDRSGLGFSVDGAKNNYFTEYIDQFQIKETVESALAVGRGSTVLTVLKQLIELRENPSLLWGDIKMHETKVGSAFDIYVRKAEGFPAFIVATTRNTNAGGEVHDFSQVCQEVSLKIAYPSNKGFEEDKLFSTSRIYLSNNKSPSIYIFACA